MSEVFDILSESDVPVDRRFFLFQLDLRGTPMLQSLTPFSGDGESTGDEYPFKFVDPLKYEDPNNELYWRNAISGAKYREILKKKFEEFKKNLIDSIPTPDEANSSIDPSVLGEFGNKIKFRESVDSGRVNPYIDLSPYVREVSGYTVSLGEFNNTMGLSLSPGLQIAGQGFGPTGDDAGSSAKSITAEFEKLGVSENDLIMVRSRYGKDAPYQTEFIGFVTDVDYVRNYGSVDSIELTVDGVSKFLQTSQVIRQRSLNNNDFIPGSEVNGKDSDLSLFSDQFNSFDTKKIFETILKTVLNYDTKNPENTDQGALAYKIDQSSFTGEGAISSFQHSIFILLHLYLLSVTKVIQDPYWNAIDPTEALPDFVGPVSESAALGESWSYLLDQPKRAYLRGGKQKTYNVMVAQGFELFYSQLQYPTQILDEVRANALLDLFETRDGVIVCQPPRYNKLEQGFLEEEALIEPNVEKFFAFPTKEEVEELQQKFGMSMSQYSAVFSEEADFVIKKYEFLETASTRRSDLELETHVDVQYMWGLVGTVTEDIGGGYTDPNLLVKYGLRAKGPINNPNVNNRHIAYLFAPIMLGMLNAKTRTFDLKVKDSRRYEVGKLYAIPSLGIVGFLEKATLNFSFGSVSSVTLSFIAVRDITNRLISDILASEDECLNFALCYLPHPKDEEVTKGIRDKLILDARELLMFLLDTFVSIPMYRYIPSIMDLMIAIAENPAYINKQEDSDKTADKKSELIIDSSQYASTDGENLYDTGVSLTSLENLGTFGSQNITSVAKASAESTSMDAVIYNEKVIDSFVFPSGFLAYNRLVKSNTLVSATANPNGTLKSWVEYLRTPFRISDISSNRGDFKFSQTLTNKLVELDYYLKEKSNSYQVYSKQNDSYLLFGSTDPAYYLVQALGEPRALRLYETELPTGIPLVSGEFKNSYFSLKAKTGTTDEFRLPPGHLFVWNPDSKTATFLQLSGGQYKIETEGRFYKITPKKGASMLQFTSSKSYAFLAEPIQIPSASGKTVSTRVVFNPSNPMLLLSPFAEISVERMVELTVANNLSGYRKTKEIDKYTTKYSEPRWADSSHTLGRGIDLCPGVITKVGGSDLMMDEAKVIEDLLMPAISKIRFAKTTRGVVSYPWSYLDGSNPQQATSEFIHLETTAKEDAEYLNRIRMGKKEDRPEADKTDLKA